MIPEILGCYYQDKPVAVASCSICLAMMPLDSQGNVTFTGLPPRRKSSAHVELDAYYLEACGLLMALQPAPRRQS